MTEEEYKELNGYLNESFLYLDKYYKFILDNLINIFVINDEFLKKIGNYDLNSGFKENNLTFQEVYDYARKIIESIDKNYLNLYDKLIETGELDFSYNNEYYDSSFTHNKDINLININRKFNYDDIVTLVHEFFHYTNCSKGKNTKNDILTEFISIYFEIYATNYLLKDGIVKEELCYTNRLKSTYRRANELYYVEMPLLAYNEFGSLNDSSVDLLNKYYVPNLTKEEFNNECKNLLNHFRKIKTDFVREEIDSNKFPRLFSEPIINYFKYFFGTMSAFYAINNCDINDILFVNNHIYDDNITIKNSMEKIKINPISYKMYEKSFQEIGRYMQQFDVKRK